MVRLKYRLLPELSVDGILPLAVALIDYQDILDVGIDMPAACQAVANCIDGPVAINIIDLDAVTTTSDGIMIPSAIRSMAAADRGKIHPEFGYIPMAEIPHTDEILPGSRTCGSGTSTIRAEGSSGGRMWPTRRFPSIMLSLRGAPAITTPARK